MNDNAVQVILQSVYLSLCELLPETEPIEVRRGQCDLDLVDGSV